MDEQNDDYENITPKQILAEQGKKLLMMTTKQFFGDNPNKALEEVKSKLDINKNKHRDYIHNPYCLINLLSLQEDTKGQILDLDVISYEKFMSFCQENKNMILAILLMQSWEIHTDLIERELFRREMEDENI